MRKGLQKEAQENWPTFTDQSNNKWQAQPQEISGTADKHAVSTLEANKTSDWPTFEEACKNQLQTNQTDTTWNTFKIETGKETSEWKIVSSQQASDNGLAQNNQEQTVPGNSWVSSSQSQQQVSQQTQQQQVGWELFMGFGV